MLLRNLEKRCLASLCLLLAASYLFGDSSLTNDLLVLAEEQQDIIQEQKILIEEQETEIQNLQSLLSGQIIDSQELMTLTSEQTRLINDLMILNEELKERNDIITWVGVGIGGTVVLSIVLNIFMD